MGYADPLFDIDLSKRIDLRLAVTDDVVEDYPEHIRCREHNDKNRGNLAVYRDHLHCFVCGWHLARTIEALAYLLKVELKEAVKQAERYTRASIDGYRERTAQDARRDPMPGSLASIYHGVLRSQRSQRLSWLYARGLNDTVIDLFQLGHDGMRFVIPLHDAEGRLISLRFRRDDLYSDEKSAKYSGVKGRNGAYLFPERRIQLTQPRSLVICEGELDAIRLWQEGIPAVTSTNGAGQASHVPGLVREAFPFVTTLIVATDMDEPGLVAADATTKAAIELGFDVDVLRWDSGKDITEALQLGSLDPDEIRSIL